MNRKEFTNLLLEWRKNFINERTTPQLQQHVRRKFPVDVIFCNLSLRFNEYEQFLLDNGKDPKKPENAIIRTGNFNSLSSTINKPKDFYDILMSIEGAFPSQEDKQKFVEAYTINRKDPAIIISQYQGDFTAKRNKYETDMEIASLFYWVIHDLVHDLFDGDAHFDRKHSYKVQDKDNPLASYVYVKDYDNPIQDFESRGSDILGSDEINGEYITQYTDFSKEEYESGKLKEKPIPGNITSELVSWFHSISYTPYVGRFDIIPSMFSYCTIKLPEEQELAKKEINKLELSNEAKNALLEMHKAAHRAMKIFVNNFGGKILLFGDNS